MLLFVFQAVSAGIFAYIAMLVTEPKKQRIADYNDLLKQFSDALSQTNDLAIGYWSSDGQNMGLEAHLLSAKTECNRLATTLNRKNCELYNYDSVSRKTFAYFKIITGDTFRQKDRKSDTEKLDQANVILRDLKDSLESAKFSSTLKNIAFLGVD